MSETSNGMPDLSAGDSEPSMEDILASIRKIIADDKTDAPVLETGAEDLLSVEDDFIQDISDVSEVTSSFSETVDEQQFEIPEIEGTSQTAEDLVPDFNDVEEEPSVLEEIAGLDEQPEFEDEEILDLINFAEEETLEEASVDEIVDEISDFEPATGEVEEVETSFDESLDLVMDADASDYYTESAESDENRLLREEIENDLNIDAEVFEPTISPDIESDLLSSSEDLSSAPDLDALLSSELTDHQDILSLDDEATEEIFSVLSQADEDGEVLGENEAEVEEVEMDDADSILSDIMEMETETFVEEPTPAPLSDDITSASEDQDMDLVKSLLADLMDEPEAGELEDELLEETEETLFSEAEEEPADVENILDEILYQSMDDETAISEADDEGPVQEESELAQIARNAREAAVSPYQNSDEVRDEDTVNIPERNLGNKLNLAAAGGFVGVAAGAAIGSTASRDVPDDLDAQVSQMVDEELELEEIEELLEMIEQTETETVEPEQELSDADQAALEELVEELETPQENEDMGRAAKKETLLDEDIEQESSEAFAALSHVVQEKAEMEENGPAIGDLVQDALRPMLKEWLDKNLKGIVERAVTKEVKRISAGK